VVFACCGTGPGSGFRRVVFTLGSQREEVIVERCGQFSRTLQAGCHCLVPCADRPKLYSYEYYKIGLGGSLELVRKNSYRVSMQTEVIDTPQLMVITRDNARVALDAIVTFRINQSKTAIYATQNLPNMLSKLMQAQVRDVAGQLDVDQLIESNAAARAAARVSAEMAAVAMRWGASVEFVKFQNVETGELKDALAQAKNASLSNNALFVTARSTRQTTIIDAEAQRDKMIREAEGSAAQIVSNARGRARAIVNEARGEAETARVIGRVVAGRGGENVTQYLLSIKYIDALREIVSRDGTDIRFLPKETSKLQTLSILGLNTVAPRGSL
jgi:regulator of protease activity HflC (stomatin/prohibitin superfamily)